MKREDEFAAWLTGIVLRSSHEDIQVLVLDDLVGRMRDCDDLLEVVNRSTRQQRRAGDFGMEIIGPLIMPALIEAGRLLWQSYMKKIAEKAAEATADAIKDRVRRAWKGDGEASAREEFAALLRKVGAAQGLSGDQIEKLVAALEAPKLADDLKLN
jgi:hypothetical protein